MIFKELEQFNIQTEDCFFDYFATFDSESVLEKMDGASPSGKLNWQAKHRPITVSIA